MTIRPWTQTIHLHSDVERGDTATSTYAIDLGALVEGDPSVPRYYRQAHEFFAMTHLTSGMVRLLHDVLEGLTGAGGDHVLQLRSPFGGGKSHTLAMLYHAAKERAALDQHSEAIGLPDPGSVRIAVFDGEKFDVQGKEINGNHVQTLWGNIAAQLGCYELVRFHDENRVAPAGDVIVKMLGKEVPDGQPTLIILDEVLKYLERASAVPVGDSYLGRLTLEFLQSLSVEVARTAKAMMIYSLQASNREALGNEGLLNILDHLTSRVDAKREPVSGDEILPVLRRRLLAESPNHAISREVAEAMAGSVTRLRIAYASDEITRRNAEDDRMELTDRFQASYPFHPELIAILRERWASLPDFQRTRGALRFLAVCLHASKVNQVARAILGPGDIPLQDSNVLQALFTEVGSRGPFQAVLERDFFGPNARVTRIDERLSLNNPQLNTVRPALRIATAILLYSFGGRLRSIGPGEEPVAVGVEEHELLGAVVSPELDTITAQVALRDLREQCLYLHFDGVRYAFKTTPNINQLLEEYSGRVLPTEIDLAIRDELENRLSGRPSILWPMSSSDIPDRDTRFLIAYLPLDIAHQSEIEQGRQFQLLISQHGDALRRYRNGLGLAIPDTTRVNEIRRSMRHLKGIERVRGNRIELNLTPAHMEQLKEYEHNDKVALESGLRNLYQSVWLPLNVNGEVGIEKVSVLGRPLQSTTVHERLIELLRISPPHIFQTITPEKIIELMRLGGGNNSDLGVATGKIVDTFFQVVGYPRLENSLVLSRALTDGISRGLFGYIGQANLADLNQLKEGGTYRVRNDAVRIGIQLRLDEIDMSTGVIVLQKGIAPAELVDQTTAPSQPSITPGGPMSSGTTVQPVGPGPYIVGGSVRFKLRLNRQQLFASWNALKNLVEMANIITMIIEAQNPAGFDPTWLRNAVIEPLEEADINMEQE